MEIIALFAPASAPAIIVMQEGLNIVIYSRGSMSLQDESLLHSPEGLDISTVPKE